MKKYVMPSEAQIAKWKKEHGVLHKLTVHVPGKEDAICIVRSPKVSDISQSATLGEGDEFKIGSIQLANCWLDGDERIKSNLAFLQAAAVQMGRVFEVYPWNVQSEEVTNAFIEKLKTQGSDAELISKVQLEGVVRCVTITLGSKAILKDGIDTRETIKAYFKQPDLAIKEKADLVSDFLDQGSVYINECFLFGDARFTDHSDEHIAFAAYMAGHSLLEKLTAEVTKL